VNLGGEQMYLFSMNSEATTLQDVDDKVTRFLAPFKNGFASNAANISSLSPNVQEWKNQVDLACSISSLICLPAYTGIMLPCL